MRLLLDIGNTNIKIALVKDTEIIKKIILKTDLSKTEDNYYSDICNLLKLDKIDAIIISSVVPILLETFKDFSKKYFNIEPFIICAGKKTGVFVTGMAKNEVGVDIISDCAYAVKRASEAIIVDLGSANKYIYVKDNKLAGALICAGISFSIKALAKNTALLPLISLEKPTSLLGKNTFEALNFGAIYSLASEIEGIVLRIKEEIKKDCIVYLTGGAALYVKEILKVKTCYVENLTTYGMLDIFLKNEGV